MLAVERFTARFLPLRPERGKLFESAIAQPGIGIKLPMPLPLSRRSRHLTKLRVFSVKRVVQAFRDLGRLPDVGFSVLVGERGYVCKLTSVDLVLKHRFDRDFFEGVLDDEIVASFRELEEDRHR